MWYSWNKNACKENKICTRCKTKHNRKFFANGIYWNYRDNICFICLFWIDRYKPKPRLSLKEDIDLMSELRITEKTTWFSHWLIKNLLKRYTHTEIRNAKIVEGKIYISNLY